MTDIPVVFLVSGMALYTGIHHLLLALNNPQKRLHIYLGLIGILVFIYDILCGNLYLSDSFELSLWIQRGQFSVISLITALAVFYVSKKYAGDIHYRFHWIGYLWLIFSLISWIDSPWLLSLENPAPKTIQLFSQTIHYKELNPGILFSLLYVSFFAAMSYFVYFILHKLRQENTPPSPLILTGIFICYACAINDILVGMGLWDFIYLTEYGYLLVVLLTDLSLTREFQDLYKTSTSLNQILEQRVNEQVAKLRQLTHALQEKNQDLQDINLRLQSMTEKDPLTNLYHGRAFYKRLEESLNLAKREGIPLAIGMIDVDHFKQVNDTYGHLIGDQVLCAVADLLSPQKSPNRLRNYDIISRYGGDEFAIALYGCDPDKTKTVLERLCQAVRSMKFQIANLRVTLSIGATIYHNACALPAVDDILAAADRALYRAKARGRDCYVIESFC